MRIRKKSKIVEFIQKLIIDKTLDNYKEFIDSFFFTD